MCKMCKSRDQTDGMSYLCVCVCAGKGRWWWGREACPVLWGGKSWLNRLLYSSTKSRVMSEEDRGSTDWMPLHHYNNTVLFLIYERTASVDNLLGRGVCCINLDIGRWSRLFGERRLSIIEIDYSRWDDDMMIFHYCVCVWWSMCVCGVVWWW